MNKHIITLLRMCSTHASAAMPAEGDSTTAANQSMRVMTFKALPGTERTYYYHRDHRGMKNKGQIRLYSTSQYGLTIFWKEK